MSRIGHARPILTMDELKEAVAYYRDQPEVVFDTETTGEHRLDPRRNQVFWLSIAANGRADAIPFGHPIGHQIGTTKEPRVDKNGKTRMFTIPVWSRAPEQLWPQDVFDALEPVFYDPDRTLIGWNLKFDVCSIAKYYDDQLPTARYADAMVAAYLLDENFHSYRLGDAIKREFGYTYDKSVGKEVEKHPFKVATRYAYLDAKYTWLLSRRYLPQIDKQGLDGVFALDMDLMRVLGRMEMTGSPLVDIDALNALDSDLDARLVNIVADLYRLAGRQWNLNSNAQKAAVFYGRKRDGGQGLYPARYTRTGAPSCDEASLKVHAGNPLVDRFTEYQEIYKLSSTYVKAYLGKEVKGRGKERNNAPPYNPDTRRIHTSYNQTRAVTGRLSSSAPNVQNIPRPDTELGKRIRGLFIAAEGNVLVVADWSQIEYRVMAKLSMDRQLLKVYREGLDLHRYVAAMLLGKDEVDVTDIERTLSKNANFAVAYGALEKKVAAMSGVSVEHATVFMREHRKLLPELYRWRAWVIKECRRQRPPHVTTMLGRVRRLPTINASDKWLRLAAERQAVNSVVQGSAGDLLKVAMIRQDRLCGPRMQLNLTVHDELVVTVPETEAERGVAIITEAMTGPGIARLLAPVPLVADIKVVRRWSDAKG